MVNIVKYSVADAYIADFRVLNRVETVSYIQSVQAQGLFTGLCMFLIHLFIRLCFYNAIRN